MNVRILVLSILALAVLAVPSFSGETPIEEAKAQETSPAETQNVPAAGGKKTAADAAAFGAPVTVKKVVPIAKLEKKPARYAGKTIRLEGVVANVCQGRGCWIELEGPGGITFLAKSLDESVLVPKDCKGQKVVVQGVVTRLTAKGHDHAAHAAEAEEAGHSCPAPNWVLATQGVELRPRSE